jgi:hypothetical protein
LGLKKKFPYSHPHCVAIKKKIDNINKDLDERWDELCRNPQNQPERIGPGEELCETRRGHRTIINDVSRNRDYWQERYDNECGDDDPDPQPVCNDNCRQVFTKVTDAITGVTKFVWLCVGAAAAAGALP